MTSRTSRELLDRTLIGFRHPQNDTWIAACCLAYDRPLSMLNLKDVRDFAEYEGLMLITG